MVGVEIIDGAQPVHRFPFRGNTAFMLGNEVRPGQGRACGTRAAAAIRPTAWSGMHVECGRACLVACLPQLLATFPPAFPPLHPWTSTPAHPEHPACRARA